jgi:hypothetical protein
VEGRVMCLFNRVPIGPRVHREILYRASFSGVARGDAHAVKRT